jgi:hypothetical protein
MQSTQLTCPHCGSTLNFGAEITAGTPVECLICMRTFAATNPVAGDATAPEKPLERLRSIDTAELPTFSDVNTNTMTKAPKAKPASSSDILVAKPYAAPVAEKSTPPAAPTRPSPTPAVPRCAEDSGVGNNVVLLAGTVVLLLLLTAGIAVGVWKLTSSARTGSAVSQNGDKPNDKNGIPVNAANPDDGGGSPLVEGEDDDLIRVKFQDELKQVLKRKISSNPANELDWDPVLNVAKAPIVGLDQQRINAAIEKGVQYLKKTQQANGTWNQGHGVGHAALGGLTLLECQVDPNDPSVQRAANFVRSQSANLAATYELSLAILFLDRLGDRRDQPLIQGMAMRLLAGQNACGGWSYQCKQLPTQDMFQLYNFLQTNQPLLNPLGIAPKGLTLNLIRDPNKLNDPFQKLNDMILTNALAGSPKSDPKSPPAVQPKPAPVRPIKPEMLNPSVRNLPIVQSNGKAKSAMITKRQGLGDNSNTQFALLALWAARRHGVPSDLALITAQQRFITSQNDDSGWGYLPVIRKSTNTMTCVGLLGLAMGHGAAPVVVVNPKNPKDITVKPALEDPRIQNGLQALARSIGQPSIDKTKTQFAMENLYFLWSVERVAMLYDLKTIGGKDWYGWGAQILVHNQNAAGAWPSGQYHGSNPPLNTCFALLFLRRSNLVQDLTNNLRLQSGVRDPQ